MENKMINKINRWNDEYDIEFSCPNCGSNEVVLELSGSYYHVDKCKRCNYGHSSKLILFNN